MIGSAATMEIPDMMPIVAKSKSETLTPVLTDRDMDYLWTQWRIVLCLQTNR